MPDDLTPAKLSPRDIPQGAFDLYDAYCHGDISRRRFFDQLSAFAVGGVTVSMLAGCMLPNYDAAQTESGAADIVEETLNYAAPKGAGDMQGYLVRPAKAKTSRGGIVIIHENRGLNPHIRDVTRRAAQAGYTAFAPDALFPLGGYPGTDDAGRDLQAKRDRAEMVEDFVAAAEFLKDRTGAKVGCTGFCFGGAVANLMAVRLPWLAAAVPYYGGWPTAEEAPRVSAPLLIHLAAEDPRVNDGWPVYEAALKAAGKSYETDIYPGTQHGFHNDTTARFNAEAAALSWQRTLGFFARHVG
jgi:carboxymethylenebutenolidase